MVDQTSTFEGSEQNLDQGQVQENNQANTFAVPDSLSELVGEGKKYSSVDKALESIAPAQDHIQRLESEMAELKAQLSTQSSVEETLRKFAEQKAVDTPTSQPVDLNEVVNQVTQRLDANAQAEQRVANQKSVANKLAEQFGDMQKAKGMFEAKAKELGMSVQDMDNLAATSPQAVFQMFGTGAQSTSQRATQSSVNTEAMQSTTNPTPQEVPGVMFGASAEQVADAWRLATQHIK